MPPAPKDGVDLHIHSSCSDGALTPAQLCIMARGKGLRHIALCDHDTLGGLKAMQEAVQRTNSLLEANPPDTETTTKPMDFIPAVEMSTGRGGYTHILGYGVPLGPSALSQALEVALQRRRERFRQMLRCLEKLGISIPRELLPTFECQAPGRAHLARALVQMGRVSTVPQAFGQYLEEGKPAYVPYNHMPPLEAVGLLRQVGAVPVLAHPCRLSAEGQARLTMIDALRQGGLMGLEVYHPSASRRDIRQLDSFARSQGLLVTGGSDFHAAGDGCAAMGKLPSGWTRVKEDVEALRSSIQAGR